MDAQAQFPTLPPAPLAAVAGGTGGSPLIEQASAASGVQSAVVVALSPEALAVLEGALEPSEALADAARSGRDNANPLLDIAGARGVFELYGQVDVDGDGELDGPAGAASVDEEDNGEPPANLAEAEEASTDQPGNPESLTDEEQEQVDKLRSRDAAVRAHEFAHAAAGGGLTGAIRFSYQTGPDGKRYAVGGSVSIDTSPGSTPEETITKAQRIRAAAMAPADPSGQDRAVAAQAGAMEARARAQLASERRDEIESQLANVGQELAPQQPTSAPEVAATHAASGVEGHEAVPSLPSPPPPAERPQDRVVTRSAPTMPVMGGQATLRQATLATFESGNVAQARLYGMPAPDNAIMMSPVEEQDLPAHLLR